MLSVQVSLFMLAVIVSFILGLIVLWSGYTIYKTYFRTNPGVFVMLIVVWSGFVMFVLFISVTLVMGLGGDVLHWW